MLAFGLSACGGDTPTDPPADPERGSISFTVVAEGTGSDPNGLTIRFNKVDSYSTPKREVTVGETILVPNIVPGSYRVSVEEGLTPLCGVRDTELFVVEKGRTADVRLVLDCVGQFIFARGDLPPAPRLELVSADGSISVLPGGEPQSLVSVSPDRSRIVTSDATGSYIRRLADPASAIAIPGGGQWSPDGRYIAGIASGKALIIDDTSGAVVDTVPTPAGRGAVSATWSPDGALLAVADLFSVWMYDPSSRSIRELGRYGRNVQDLLWSPGRLILAEGTGPRAFLFIDSESGEVAHEFSDDALGRARWLSPERLVAAFARTLVLIDLRAETVTPLLPPGTYTSPGAPNPSEDFDLVLFSARSPEGVHVLHVESGKIRHVVEGGLARDPVWLPYSGGFRRAPPPAPTGAR